MDLRLKALVAVGASVLGAGALALDARETDARDCASPALALRAATMPLGESVPAPPAPEPTGAPDTRGVVVDGSGSPVACVGIYRVDASEVMRHVATTDASGSWSTPCRLGRLLALSFEPYVESTAPAEYAFRSLDNPANDASPCATRARSVVQPAAVLRGALVTAAGEPATGVRRLEITCTDLDQFSGRPLRVVRTDEQGRFVLDGLGACGVVLANGPGVADLGTNDVVPGQTRPWSIVVE